MDLKVEQWPVERLVPYKRNPRVNDHAVERMATTIREFGFRVPVLARSSGEVMDGHLRLKAARKLGMASVPVALVDDLTDAQVRAFRLAINKSAEWAEWDETLLVEELGDLFAEGFDLALTGFDDAELSRLIGTNPNGEGLTDPDDVPAERERTVSVLGDAWLLGKHRLVCGDCTDATIVAKALNGVTPHLMATDPPYGVEYDPAWRNDAVQAGRGARGAPSGRAIGKVENDERADWREAWALFPGDVAYVWHGALHAGTVQESLIACGFAVRAQIIWAKSNIAISRGHYHWQHEPCWYAVRKDGTGHWAGDRKQTTLWQIPKPVKSETGHGTQKPVECMKRPMENNSSPGQAVYEPFSGSGTTIIAAQMTGRVCHAVELNPVYVDLAVRRWQDFTGQQATLEGDGRTFAEIEGERLGAA